MLLSFIKKRLLENHQSKGNIVSRENNVKTIHITAVDKVTIKSWLILPEKPKKGLKYIVFLHGNRINRKTFCNAFNINNLVNTRNYVILIPDYRDFGDSEGIFEKEKVNKDIASCCQFMIHFFDIEKVNIIGHSLGGGIALNYAASVSELEENCTKAVAKNTNAKMEIVENVIDKADKNTKIDTIELNKIQTRGMDSFDVNKTHKDTQKDYDALQIARIREVIHTNKIIHYEATEQVNKNMVNKIAVLSTFTSILDMIENSKIWKIIKIIHPLCAKKVDRLYNYNNIENIQKIEKNNIKIFHGENDELIPIEHGRKLAEKASIDLNVIKNADHCSLLLDAQFWDEIDVFLNSKTE
ncbi:hypothetical protein BDAP_001429 [Binucleata daphniae]